MSSRFPGSGLYLLVVVEREPNPIVKVALCFHSICLDVYIASVLPALHHHGPATFALKRGVMDCRIDAAHDSVPTHADTHPSSHHESDTAKHPLFFDTGSAREGCPYPLRQYIVVWHTWSSSSAT